MILGISSFTYGWSIGVNDHRSEQNMNELTLLETAKRFDLNCLQLGDNLPVHHFSDKQKEDFRSLIQQQAFRLELGARKLTMPHVEEYISLCAYFKSPLLRFVIDGDDYEPESETIIDILKDAIPLLQQNKITLGIENHDRFKAKELAHIIESVGHSSIGICLDCVNSMGAGEGLEHVLEVLAPFTVNLHIKDFSVQRLSHKMGFNVTGVPAGKGMVNVPLLLEKLMKYNRCESAILEQWVPFENSIEQTVRTEEAWAVESMEYLKTIPTFNFKHKIKNVL